MQRRIDALTDALLTVQIAQREVDVLIFDLVVGIAADPFRESSLLDFSVSLSGLRSAVDQRLDDLMGAVDRMGEPPPPPNLS